MYNKSISKKIMTAMILIIVAALVVATLLIYTILAKVQIERSVIHLDEAHVQALHDAGFKDAANGYIKEDVRMSFQVYTKGTSDYRYPNVTMVFLAENETIQSEKIMYDPENKTIQYLLKTTSGEIESTLNAANLDILTYQVSGDLAKPSEENNETKEELLAQHQEGTKNRIKEKMMRFLATFGLSAENALGYETAGYITEIADENATFGQSALANIATQSSEGNYVYKNGDETITMTFYPSGSKLYAQPHVIIVNKNTGVTTTFVPEMGTMMCAYPENKKQISVAYELREGKILLYQENVTNLTSRRANDEALKSKLQQIYAQESKLVQDTFQMSVDMLLQNNKTVALTPLFPNEKKEEVKTETTEQTPPPANTEPNPDEQP